MKYLLYFCVIALSFEFNIFALDNTMLNNEEGESIEENGDFQTFDEEGEMVY